MREEKEIIEKILDVFLTFEEDNCYPGGYYFKVEKLSPSSIAIDEGEYGRWHRTLKLELKELDYTEY